MHTERVYNDIMGQNQAHSIEVCCWSFSLVYVVFSQVSIVFVSFFCFIFYSKLIKVKVKYWSIFLSIYFTGCLHRGRGWAEAFFWWQANKQNAQVMSYVGGSMTVPQKPSMKIRNEDVHWISSGLTFTTLYAKKLIWPKEGCRPISKINY